MDSLTADDFFALGLQLDPHTGAYTPTGIHHGRLKLAVPFTIDIDLTEIDRL
ncbi:hypothetical protein [Streptomyces sp. NPDC058308]|uniref:hypothetical protein n=1 Tax=Streptomyces sp. NPDC058308 TaxID=3346440 RepID=UPI0036E5AAE8